MTDTRWVSDIPSELRPWELELTLEAGEVSLLSGSGTDATRSRPDPRLVPGHLADRMVLTIRHRGRPVFVMRSLPRSDQAQVEMSAIPDFDGHPLAALIDAANRPCKEVPDAPGETLAT